MKISVSEHTFVNRFDEMNRGNNFSRDARRAMFEYFEDLDEQCGTETELDVIAVCCEWSEYESLEEFRKDYGEEYQTLDDVRDATRVIEFDGGFVIQQF